MLRLVFFFDIFISIYILGALSSIFIDISEVKSTSYLDFDPDFSYLYIPSKPMELNYVAITEMDISLLANQFFTFYPCTYYRVIVFVHFEVI